MVRRAAAVVGMTVLLCACSTVTSGIFARVEVECGATSLMFSNADKLSKKIVVKATDQCAGVDSEVQLINSDGRVTERYAVPNGTTETLHIVVPSGDWLNFVCHGTAGGCSYTVSGE